MLLLNFGHRDPPLLADLFDLDLTALIATVNVRFERELTNLTDAIGGGRWEEKENPFAC